MKGNRQNANNNACIPPWPYFRPSSTRVGDDPHLPRTWQKPSCSIHMSLIPKNRPISHCIYRHWVVCAISSLDTILLIFPPRSTIYAGLRTSFCCQFLTIKPLLMLESYIEHQPSLITHIWLYFCEPYLLQDLVLIFYSIIHQLCTF
jgi:hypothetical protein